MASQTALRLPREGEVWKSDKGAIRIVAHLEDDPEPYWVMFRRPPSAVEEYATVLMSMNGSNKITQPALRRHSRYEHETVRMVSVQ
jgi:hypothetical protein